jgi:hypothetical protein
MSYGSSANSAISSAFSLSSCRCLSWFWRSRASFSCFVAAAVQTGGNTGDSSYVLVVNMKEAGLGSNSAGGRESDVGAGSNDVCVSGAVECLGATADG